MRSRQQPATNAAPASSSTDRRACRHRMKAGLNATAARPCPRPEKRELKSMSRHEHRAEHGPRTGRRQDRGLIDGPRLLRILTAENHDGPAFERGSSGTTGRLWQIRKSNPRRDQRVVAIHAWRSWRTAARRARVWAVYKAGNVIARRGQRRKVRPMPCLGVVDLCRSDVGGHRIPADYVKVVAGG